MARSRFGPTLSLDNPLLRRRTPVGAPPRASGQSLKSRDWRAYAEARRNSADIATRGNLLNAAGRRAGVSPGQWFTGRAVSSKYASDELKDWLKANGPTLSPSAYRAQIIDPPRAASYGSGRMSGS